jgi:thiamine-phosphate pyrophosphorylase
MAKTKRKTTPQKPVADTIVPRLYLLTPILSDVQAFAPELEAAMDAGDVACVLVQVTGNDEGEIKKAAQRLAPIVQGREAALLVEGDPRIAARVNADGVHVRAKGEALGPALANAVESCRPDRIVGAGGLRSRDDAMTAGEADVDYVMFGEPAPDGWTPPPEQVLERAAWWAEIFNVPCVAYANTLEEVAELAAARVDFIALREAIWNDPRGPAAAVRDAQATIDGLEADA